MSGVGQMCASISKTGGGLIVRSSISHPSIKPSICYLTLIFDQGTGDTGVYPSSHWARGTTDRSPVHHTCLSLTPRGDLQAAIKVI